ncbi:MAG: hypothetical protein WCT85_04400, partial [Parachlamydiales bacterium]
IKHEQKSKEETIPKMENQKKINVTDKSPTEKFPNDKNVKNEVIKPEEFKMDQENQDSKKENLENDSCKIKLNNRANKEDSELKYNLWE